MKRTWKFFCLQKFNTALNVRKIILKFESSKIVKEFNLK